MNRLLVTLLFSLALSAPRAAFASGEPRMSTFFDYLSHPDFPLEEFAAGHLGVLQPGYRREYLAVAYRLLRGGRLDAGERAGAADLMKARLRLPSDRSARQKAAEAHVAGWLKARALVKGARPAIEMKLYKESAAWVSYSSCMGDAFDTAARALRDRVTRLGADSVEVTAWVEAQDLVFTSCGDSEDGAPPPAIPGELATTASASARADRDYQIAAAHFYQSHFEEAVERFHQIARDPASSWAPLGNYLAARTLIRKATLAAELDRVALADAERELRAIATAPDSGGPPARAERLLNLVAFYLRPEEQVRALARRVAGGSQDLRDDLTDYLWLLARTRETREAAPQPLLDLAKLRAEDDLTDWVLEFASFGGLWDGADDIEQARRRAEALDHALARYHATRSLPWLVAALMLVPASHPEASALLEAAARLPDGSPAHDTLLFHSLRIQIESGHDDRIAAARKRLDALLPALRAGRASATLNRFLALRFRAAASLDDLVDFAQRMVLGTGYEDSEAEVPDDLSPAARKRPPVYRFDDDGADLFARGLPLALLVKLLDHPRLADTLRPELTRALFLRAVALDDLATAVTLRPAAEPLLPDVPAWKEGLTGFAAAATDEERAFAVVFMTLKVPGLKPWVDAGAGRQAPAGKQDEFRDNWWCSPHQIPLSESRPAITRAPLLPALAFLAEPDRKAAEAELARLAKAGAGADWLAARTLDFARTHPDDPRLPEALYLVNRATHFGCKDDKTSSWSKQAYLLLHKQWPRSEWARKVKYWW